MSVRNRNYRCGEERPASTDDEKQYSLDSIPLARAARHSQNKPDESRPGRPTFIEDFLLEHFSFRQPSRFDSVRGLFLSHDSFEATAVPADS